jgi:predicted permease
MATPVGVSSYLLAERFRADADAVAGYVVISTLISVLALPVLLYFLL